MKRRTLLPGMLGALLAPACFSQSLTLDLVTFEAPPYQVPGVEYRERGHVTGETVETIVCAVGQAGMFTRITMAPQKRAEYSLRRNLTDGYFAVDPSTELDSIAARSDPVALEKWYFFTLKPEVDPESARIGVVDGSNEEAWLTANGYDIFLRINSPGQLLALLKRGRIDAALMDSKVMNSLYAGQVEQTSPLHARFLRYAPLYLYLSDTFATAHPDFMPRFNHFLPPCMSPSLQLTASEKQHVERLSKQLVSELHAIINLQQAVEAGPRMETFTDVLTADSKWQALAPRMATPLASQVLDLPGSKALFAWQRAHKGLITEAMLMNDMGTLAAMSQLTSDFWQGDEPKFQAVMNAPLEASTGKPVLYISPIRYDSSTARFQITVSIPLALPNGGAPDGAISFGLDIERALEKMTGSDPE
jgi:hypothetical protein